MLEVGVVEMTILMTGWAGACVPVDSGQAGYRKRTRKEEPDRQQRDGGGGELRTRSWRSWSSKS